MSALKAGVMVLSVAALCMLSATHAFAQDDAFKKGLDARGQKKWSMAAEEMRKAIEADGKESTRKVRDGFLGAFGGGTEYLPHYFLGEALANLGDCAGAVAAWEASEDQKVVLTRPEFASQIRRGYQACGAKGVLLRNEYRQEITAADQAYQTVYDAAERVMKFRTGNPDLWRPETEAEYERGRNELDAARSHLIKARRSRVAADFAQAREASTRAGELLRPLETGLNTALSDKVAVQSRWTEAQTLISTAEDTDRAIDATRVTLPLELSAARETARQSIARAREQVGKGDSIPSTAAVAQVEGLARDASRAIAAIFEEARKIARTFVERQLQIAVSSAKLEFSFVQTLFGRLDQLSAAKPGAHPRDMARRRELLQRDAGTATRRFETAQRSANVSGVQEAARLATATRLQLDGMIREFGAVTLRDRGVDEALEDGVRYYLRGEYQKAIDALGRLSDVALQVHVHLFRAASLHALYLLSGETEQTLKTRALEEVQRCKEMDATFKPSPRAFTPRFVRFFQNPNATTAASPGTAR